MTEPLIRYETDPTGTSVENLVTDEQQVLVGQSLRILVPKYNPFFTKNLIVKDTATNAFLTRGTQYQCVELVDELTLKFGEEVAQVILIIDPTVSANVSITYQTVGGDYPDNSAALIDLYNRILTTDTFVPWMMVQNKPSTYPPSLHNHLAVDFWGWEHLVVVINRIKAALELSNTPSLEASLNWLDGLLDQVKASIDLVETNLLTDINQAESTLTAHIENFGNPHLTNKTQIGLGNVGNYSVATPSEAIAGTSNVKYSTPSTVKDGIDEFAGTVLNEHLSTFINPHTVTKAQVGLSNIQNFTVATNDEAEVAELDDRYMTPAKTVVELEALVDESLFGHTTRTDNPHSVNKSQIGLPLVENFAVASSSEAMAGVAENRYMTPLRTKEAIDGALSGTMDTHLGDFNNPHKVTKTQIGLESVENYSIASEQEAKDGVLSDRYVTPYLVKSSFTQLQAQPVAWSSISNIPATFPPDTHTHSYNNITGKPATFTPSTHTHDWSTVVNKPTSYTTGTHTHLWEDISDKPSSYPPSAHTHTWNSVINKPSLYPPSTHTHAWSDLLNKPLEFPPAVHTHELADFSGIANIVSVNIVGPSSGFGLVAYNFFISNYDSYTDYNVSTLFGTVERVEDTITYTPQNVTGFGGFNINGRDIEFTVTAAAPDTPTISSPTTGAINQNETVRFTASAFSIIGNVDSHHSSDWELSTDAGFTNIVAQVTASTTNKTTWSVSSLSVSTTYYARVRYNSNVHGQSGWSNTVSFTTKAIFGPTVEIAKLMDNPIRPDEKFGASVGMDATGTRLLVGIPNFTAGGTAPALADVWAAIYIRDGSSWSLEAKLQAPMYNGKVPLFGYTVSISDDGTVAAVSVMDPVEYHGGVAIFRRSGTTWTYDTTIAVATGIETYSGEVINISGDGKTVFIASPYDSWPETGGKSVFVYVDINGVWTYQASLNIAMVPGGVTFRPENSLASDYTGDRVLVGRVFNTFSSAVVSVFKRTGTTWAFESHLVPPDYNAVHNSGSGYGESISLTSDGSRALVGNSTGNGQAGLTYSFVRTDTTWTREAVILPPTNEVGNLSGSAVALSDDGVTAIIGAPGNLSGKGAFYHYTRSGSTWTLKNTIFASDGATGDRFGNAASMSTNGEILAVASLLDDTAPTTNHGSVYIFG